MHTRCHCLCFHLFVSTKCTPENRQYWTWIDLLNNDIHVFSFFNIICLPLCRRYADFLSRLNDDRNIRALFERALSSLQIEESTEVYVFQLFIFYVHNMIMVGYITDLIIQIFLLNWTIDIPYQLFSKHWEKRIEQGRWYEFEWSYQDMIRQCIFFS